MHTPAPLPVAVPSWMMAGTAAENARFLSQQPPPCPAVRIVDMGLCCFEAQASLACPRSDYPAASPALSLHVHLPLDLHWQPGQTPVQAPAQVLALMERLRPLGITRAVLHPPAETQGGASSMATLLAAWTDSGRDPADLLLENHRELPPEALLALLDAHPVSVCLDLAHMWTYGQDLLFSHLDPARVRLVHWSAPGPVPGKDAHLPLTSLSRAELDLARAAAVRFRAALPLVEVFSWAGVVHSLPVLADLYRS